MPRLAVVLLGVLLLAGCSAGGAVPQSDPSATQRGAGSLEGVTSEYSIRLAEMPRYEELDRDSVMRNGLIAGDAEVHVAASACRSDDHYVLDLIVNNRGGLPLTLDRDDVRLVDSAGQWMIAVNDFPRADELGLRGRTERPASSLPYDGLGLYDNESFGNPVGYTSNNLGGKNTSGGAPDDSPAGQGLAIYEWDPETPVAPKQLEVPGGEGRAWWAYWKSESAPVFPLTAFVTVEGKHMIFIFEE